MEHSTTSVGEALIALREDIRFRPQHYCGQTCYVIEDPTSSNFYRIGTSEYTLISLFDGTNSISDAMHHASAVLGRDAFSEEDAASIARWLVECGLAKTNTSNEAMRLDKKSRAKNDASRRQRMNPIITKLPLFRPEKLIDWFSPYLMWTTSRMMFIIWVAAILVAIHQLVTHSNQLSFSVSEVLTPDNWLWLGVVWLVLKLIHESYHALFCRKYKGEVREAGVVLIAFAPIFYVDVTSSWRFRSKWERIAVAAAGMYAEVFVGAIAAIVWIHSDPGMVNRIALNVLLLSTVTTLLFNANPLMRFDGYYILSDFMEIPNLAPQGQSYLSYVGRKFFYGVKLNSPLGLTPQDVFVRLYGVAAMVWRFLITISIGIMVATLFHGAGLGIVMIGLVFWIGMPVVSNVRYFLFGRDHEQPNRVFATSLAATWVAAIVLACNFCPWPFIVKAPGVVDYRAGGIVRADVGGFVKTIHVKPGQHVEQGQLLAELENVQLRAEAARLTSALRASEKRIDMASTAGDVSAQKIEQENRRNFRLQLDERSKQLASFQIVAPVAGQVVVDELDSLVGTFLQQGQELLVIGDEHQKEIRLSIAQEDARLFASQVGSGVNVKMRGGNFEKFSLALSNVHPGASTSIEYPSLTAAAGGVLVVRPKSMHDGTDDNWEFVAPRLRGVIELDANLASSLRAGQLAMVKLPIARSGFGTGVYRFAEQWIRHRWQLIEKS